VPGQITSISDVLSWNDECVPRVRLPKVDKGHRLVVFPDDVGRSPAGYDLAENATRLCHCMSCARTGGTLYCSTMVTSFGGSAGSWIYAMRLAGLKRVLVDDAGRLLTAILR
jgi:hypothetical protein